MSSVGKKMGKANIKTRRKSKVRIPKKYLQIGVVLFCVFIIGGGFYNLLENPPIAIPLQSGVSSLHPYLTDQTVTEGYFVMLTNLFMVTGFWLTHKASHVTYDKPKANRYLIIGIILIVLGLSSNYAILRIKRNLI